MFQKQPFDYKHTKKIKLGSHFLLKTAD